MDLQRLIHNTSVVVADSCYQSFQENILKDLEMKKDRTSAEKELTSTALVSFVRFSSIRRLFGCFNSLDYLLQFVFGIWKAFAILEQSFV